MNITIRAMRPTDYEAVHALWSQSEGIGLNDSDTAPAIAAFLARNAGLSPVAITDDGGLAGAMLCGHDGRRGYLHHLAVARGHRRQGLARRLVDFAIAGLQRDGILKVNLFVLPGNGDGFAFWEHLGWRRPTWQVMQRALTRDCGGAAGGNSC